ncbi:Alginate production protein AlgE [compost metagenome]
MKRIEPMTPLFQPRELARAVRRARLLPAMLGAGLSLAGTLLANSAWAVEEPPKNFGIDIKITAESEDDRDLGTAPEGDVNGLALDLRPWAFGQWGDWSAYTMGQAVAATDTIQTDTLQEDESGNRNDARERDDSYLALREFWVDYAGLTAYPGEHLRLGRQRLREESGLWQDTNIEALNWTFDTTLLRAHLGAAQRFSEYRTDLDDLAPADEDRTHVFGDISTQWMPHHWVGLRLHHADDSGNLPDPGEVVDELDKTSTGKLTWLGIEANGDGYDYRSQMPLNYWASATWLTGDRDRLTSAVVNGDRIATGKQSGDVDAWGVDLGLRWNIDEQWKVGGGYARGSGGGDDGEEQFQQTGLESNRSSFTGTRSRVHRFGEAFRGELSNLQDATLFGSWQLRDDYDASLVYHRFWRVDGDSDIGNSGITAPLVNDDKDIGQEVDLVVTKYFKQGLLPASMSQAIDEPSALVRFRGGLFKPGDAYGSGVDSTMHHAFVDVIWRY